MSVSLHRRSRRSFKLGIFFQNEQHHHPFFDNESREKRARPAQGPQAKASSAVAKKTDNSDMNGLCECKFLWCKN
ncbi:unnamed protein product [Prunus armeniaca]|uniref:Uncharacterized protein n=1 Tax=Prunus armeniaca TaxID=36596 RepID=A0A6J5TRX1_PRUAR|nr:unnamed protein product [Prunus armeniaca]CAB4296549.1 unnamed protein product [Prunus armeniaca]